MADESLPPSDALAGLHALAWLPTDIHAVHPTAATLAIVRPLAARAVAVRDRLDTIEGAADAARLLTEGLAVLGARYGVLSREYRRLSGRSLPILDPAAAAVVGGGALTAGVAAAVRAAWELVRRGAAAMGAWVQQHPFKATLAPVAAGAVPGLYRAGQDAGRAAAAAAGGLASVASAAGGLGGVALLLLLALWLTGRGSSR